MDQNKKNSNTLLIAAVVIVVIIGLGTWIFLTSSENEEDPGNIQSTAQDDEKTIHDKYVGGAHVSRDLKEVELTPELKKQIEVWRTQGFIKELKTSQHEVWINGSIWKTYSLEEKNKVADTLSTYMKAHDGTPQVMVRDHGSNEMLAEILGNYRDFN